MENRKRKNIAFARGGAHLPIAHALHLPETEIISWGGDFFGSVVFLVGQYVEGKKKERRKKKKKNNAKKNPPNEKNPRPTKLCLSLAGGVRALWVSEHPLWRTRYYHSLSSSLHLFTFLPE